MNTEEKNTGVEVKVAENGETNRTETHGRGLAPVMTRPFTLMRHFAEDMESMFRDFGFPRRFPHFTVFENDPFFADTPSSSWTPAVELVEGDGEFSVRAELPGMEKDDIDVSITDNFLTIKGEKRDESEKKEDGIYRSERSYGSFYRKLRLPDAVTGEAKATFKNGVLEVTLAARELTGSEKRLEITDGDAEETTAAGSGG